MITPTPEHYREAARIVRQGWSRLWYAQRGGTFVRYPRGDSFCALGAAAMAAGLGPCTAGGYGPDQDGTEALARPLAASLALAGHIIDAPRPGCVCEPSVSVWNARKSQTAREVAAALERCADDLEAGRVTP